MQEVLRSNEFAKNTMATIGDSVQKLGNMDMKAEKDADVRMNTHFS